MRKRVGKPVDKIEMLKYGIATGASDKQIAEHFRYKLSSWRGFKSGLKKTNPDLLEKLDVAQKAKGNKRQTVEPELIEQLHTAQKEGKTEQRITRGEEIIQYGIETRASDQEIAKHFGITIETMQVYKSRVKKINSELIEQLHTARNEEKREQRVTRGEEIIQYGIETRASDQEIAKHFGIKIKTMQVYKSTVKRTNPELIEQLKRARQGRKVRKETEVAHLKEENSMLREENSRLKARIALLEQELQEQRAGLQTTRQEIKEQPQEQTTHHANESEFDVLLRVFNQGKMTSHDAEVLLQFQHKLEKIQQGQSRNHRWRNALNYSTMISTIKTILATNSPKYQEERLPELVRFISAEYEGPLYEIAEDTSIGRLASIVEKRTGMKVYPEELVLIINRLITEGKSNEISGMINIEVIGNIRSRLDLCYEQIMQEGLLLTGEAR